MQLLKLVSDGAALQVCDFGLSRVRRSTWMSAKSQAGTPEWTAPEVLRGQVSTRHTDPLAQSLLAPVPVSTVHCSDSHQSQCYAS